VFSSDALRFFNAVTVKYFNSILVLFSWRLFASAMHVVIIQFLSIVVCPCCAHFPV
jgi:hypothetical protein